MAIYPPKKGEVPEKCVIKCSNDILHRLIIDKYEHISKFAEKSGFDRSYISQIIHGHKEPSIKDRIKIARALGVDSITLWPPEKKGGF